MGVVINGLNITDNTSFILEEIVYKGTPRRDIISQPVSTRPGDKLVTTEWGTKEITLKGRVFSTTTSGLVGLVDDLHSHFSVQSLALVIDSARTYTATLKDLQIPNQFFNNTMVEYNATFVCVDPFSYGTLLTASGVTTSGTVTYSGTLTVSGTVFAEPTLTINPRGALAGDSGIKAMQISNTTQGETLTISGMINYLSDLSVNYKNFLVTNSGVNSDYTGTFSRFEPGTVNYTITVSSGVNQGYNWKWSYQPRYYQ